MSNLDGPNNPRNDEPTYSGLSSPETGDVTFIVIVVVLLFLLVNAVIYFRSRHHPRHRRRLHFAPTGQHGTFLHRPLDPSILDSLPVTVYFSKDFEARGGLSCAVCLSGLVDGEEARVLPGCGHGFHVECVDMWFGSNSTCPLCRLPVGPAPAPSLEPLPHIPPCKGSSSTAGSPLELRIVVERTSTVDHV